MIIACVQRRHARYLPDPTKVRQSPRGVFRRRRVRNPDLFFPTVVAIAMAFSPTHGSWIPGLLGPRDSVDRSLTDDIASATSQIESVINEHRL